MNEKGFKKGHEKMGGRKKGSLNKMPAQLFENFLDSLLAVEKDEAISKGKDFFRFIIERAYKSDTVAIAILKKLIPDQTLNIEEWRNAHPVKVTFELVGGLETDDEEKSLAQENAQILNSFKKP